MEIIASYVFINIQGEGDETCIPSPLSLEGSPVRETQESWLVSLGNKYTLLNALTISTH